MKTQQQELQLLWGCERSEVSPFPHFLLVQVDKTPGSKVPRMVHRAACLWPESAAKASVNSTYRMKLAGEPLNFPSSSKVLSK